MNVFISYNSKNEDFAELVKLKLEKEDILVMQVQNGEMKLIKGY